MPGSEQALLPRQLFRLVVERRLRGGAIGEPLAIRRFQRLDFQSRRRETRLRLVHRDPKRPLVETEQQVALAHPLVVANRQLADPARDIGADRNLRGAHVSIVGLFIPTASDIDVSRHGQRQQRPTDHQRTAQLVGRRLIRSGSDTESFIGCGSFMEVTAPSCGSRPPSPGSILALTRF